jgi:preprotein translocase subunit YajC
LPVVWLYTAGHTTIDPTGNAMPISSAYAQAAGGAPAGFDLISLMPLVLIFVVFYFLLIRPQQKKMKAHRELIAALKRGDKVLTAGGIIGTVVKVEEDNTLLVEIAKDIRVRVARGTISELLTKPAPAAKGPAQAGSSTEGGAAKTGLMSQLFGKK